MTMFFRNAWIATWTMGAIDANTVAALGPILAFLIGAIGLLVNWRVSSRHDAMQLKVEALRATELSRQIELVNANQELARVTAIHEAEQVRVDLEKARAALALLTQEQTEDLTTKVDKATVAAKEAYTEANDVNRKLADVTKIVLVRQDQEAARHVREAVAQATREDANTAAVEENTEATAVNTEALRVEREARNGQP